MSGGQRTSPHPHPAPAGGPAPDLSITAGFAAARSAAPAHCSSEGDKHREIQSSAASEINRCAGLRRSGDNAPAPPYAPALALHLPRATGTRLLGDRLRPPSPGTWSLVPRAGVELEKKEARFVTNSEQNLGFGTKCQGSDPDCHCLTRDSNSEPGCSPLYRGDKHRYDLSGLALLTFAQRKLQ